MTYRLFIDDERYPPGDIQDWVIVRSSHEAIEKGQADGLPSFISFDHDLGGADTSIAYIKWMIETVLDAIQHGNPLPPFPRHYEIHSQNPVGAQNIRSLMDSFICFMDKHELN